MKIGFCLSSLRVKEDFLMSVGAAVHIHNTKLGSCPHGLPAGACPICSGMAGGNSTTKRDIPRNVGEMTYNQCAAIGAMLRAQKAAQKRAEAAQQNHLQALAEFTKTISNTQQRIAELASMISKSTPTVIAKPVNFVLNTVAKVLNVIQNIPNFIGNIAKAIGQKFADISDKLTAMYGEFKAAVDKKISDIWNKTKSKLKSIFFVFGTDNADDEEKKVEEAKKAFNLKTFIHKLSQKLKESDEKDDER